MEYKYSTGETIRLHDKVRIGNSLVGVVVGIVENDEYDQSVSSWKGSDYKGVLVNTDEAGLILYSEAEHIAEFVKL